MSEVDERNAKAVVAHGVATRKVVEDLARKVAFLEGRIATQEGVIANLASQVGHLRAQVLNGGPTSAD